MFLKNRKKILKKPREIHNTKEYSDLQENKWFATIRGDQQTRIII